MDITFKKKKKALEGEVVAKSMDLEHGIENFKPEIEDCDRREEYLTVSSECVRCNLCAEECPVDAISPAKSDRQVKILDNCVRCETCAQTCPVNAVQVFESTSRVEEDEDVKYSLRNLKVPHRKLRMEDIQVDPEKCKSQGKCVKFCPTGAITVEEGYTALIDREICIGCGACANVCPENAITLKRTLGPPIKTRKLLIDQEECVHCQVCEEECPMEAIKLEDAKIVLSEDKCILCRVCSNKCPVRALKLEEVAHES